MKLDLAKVIAQDIEENRREEGENPEEGFLRLIPKAKTKRITEESEIQIDISPDEMESIKKCMCRDLEQLLEAYRYVNPRENDREVVLKSKILFAKKKRVGSSSDFAESGLLLLVSEKDTFFNEHFSFNIDWRENTQFYKEHKAQERNFASDENIRWRIRIALGYANIKNEDVSKCVESLLFHIACTARKNRESVKAWTERFAKDDLANWEKRYDEEEEENDRMNEEKVAADEGAAKEEEIAGEVNLPPVLSVGLLKELRRICSDDTDRLMRFPRETHLRFLSALNVYTIEEKGLKLSASLEYQEKKKLEEIARNYKRTKCRENILNDLCDRFKDKHEMAVCLSGIKDWGVYRESQNIGLEKALEQSFLQFLMMKDPQKAEMVLNREDTEERKEILRYRIRWALWSKELDNVPWEYRPILLTLMAESCGIYLLKDPSESRDIKTPREAERPFVLLGKKDIPERLAALNLLCRICDIFCVTEETRKTMYREYLLRRGKGILSPEELVFWREKANINLDILPEIQFQSTYLQYCVVNIPLHQEKFPFKNKVPTTLIQRTQKKMVGKEGFSEFCKLNEKKLKEVVHILLDQHKDAIREYQKIWADRGDSHSVHYDKILRIVDNLDPRLAKVLDLSDYEHPFEYVSRAERNDLRVLLYILLMRACIRWAAWEGLCKDFDSLYSISIRNALDMDAVILDGVI